MGFGEVCFGEVRFGSCGSVGRGKVRCCLLRLGRSRFGSFGTVRFVLVWQVPFWYGEVRLGMAVTVWFGELCLGQVR